MPLSRQRALLFAVSREPLRELRDLLRTAGGESVGEVRQRRSEPDPDYYLGQGKLLELEHLVQKTGVQLLVCNDELSPRQERNLEQRLGVAVVDRTALILDIFALHAKSAEGKLQVEIAQIEYNMARMRGLWPHLERLGAGIGTRGPGESQIETDRRLARKRLLELRQKLARLDRARSRGRERRLASGSPKIALLGYTNSGKSTLQELLCHNNRSSADQLFHTLDTKTSVFWNRGKEYMLSDTVGLIDKLPHNLVAAFRGTLQEVIDSDLLLHVCDARRARKEIRVGEEVLSLLEIEDKPRLLVLNKVDLLSRAARERLLRRYPDALLLSATEREGTELLGGVIEERLSEEMTPVDILLPWDTALPYELDKLAFQKEEEPLEEGLRLRARIPRHKVYLFQQFLQG